MPKKLLRHPGRTYNGWTAGGLLKSGTGSDPEEPNPDEYAM